MGRKEDRADEAAAREMAAGDDGGWKAMHDAVHAGIGNGAKEWRPDGWVWMDEAGNLYPTEYAYQICEELLPEWRSHFIAKARKYRKVPTELGAKGVFPEMNRKHGIIKDRVWDGGDTVGEPTREVLMDLLGNVFMMIWMLDNVDGGAR